MPLPKKKPWDDPKFLHLSVPARMLYLIFLQTADKNGNVSIDRRFLRARYFTFDDLALLPRKELCDAGFIRPYRTNDGEYAFVAGASALSTRPLEHPLADWQQTEANARAKADPFAVIGEIEPILDSFILMCAQNNTNGKISDGRIDGIKHEVVNLINLFGREQVRVGLLEAQRHNAVSLRYVRAVAKNSVKAGGGLRSVGNTHEPEDVRQLSLEALEQRERQRRG